MTADELRALGLTAEQLEVAQRFEDGWSIRGIARALGVGPATLRSHLEAVERKLRAAVVVA